MEQPAFPDARWHGPGTGFYLPRNYYVCAGSGDAPWPLVALDTALLNAGIGNVNIIRLSSILAPGIRKIAPPRLAFGCWIGAAVSSINGKSGELISAAVAIAFPGDSSQPAVIMEGHGTRPAAETERETIAMATESLRIRGLEVLHVESVAVEHLAREEGCAMAAVVQL